MYHDYSRYVHSDLILNDEDYLELSLRTRLPYVGGIDEVMHVAVAGDTWQNLAARYYSDMLSPASLWWIIADFQPEPVIDPTVELVPNELIMIPSPAMVQDWLLSSSEEQTSPL